MADQKLDNLPNLDPQRQLDALPQNAELLAEGQNWLEHLQQALSRAGLAEISVDEKERLLRAFCCSPFVAKTLATHPEWLQQLCYASELKQAFVNKRLQAYTEKLHRAEDEADFMQQLRILRQREMIRIALRDLYGWASQEETLSALSDLADYCIEQAHLRSYQQSVVRHGSPYSADHERQSLVVLAMGKLGGRELNYSSDVDLIFAYPETGQTVTDGEKQRRTDNQTFFTGQAQLLIRYLNETTADGLVFRVDARLRPFGDSGALVTSFNFMESYYQHQGRDWERYAMIKARAICGLPRHRDQLWDVLQPFVYRRYLDYGAFTALREMKALIIREVERKNLQDNIKLGSGGIREIEFTGQAFQLIRGGREPALRCRQILTTLHRLGESAVIEPEVITALQQAYRFLRDTENRLQMVGDRQVHALPQDGLGRERLAYAMGFASWMEFKSALDQHRSAVTDCFQGIFFTHAEGGGEQQRERCQLCMKQLLHGEIDDGDVIHVLAECGFAQAEPFITQLRTLLNSNAFRHVSPLALERLASLLPAVLDEVSSVENPVESFKRVINILQAIMQRPVYLDLLNEYRPVLSQMVRLFSASGWIADFLTRQPILLDSLLDTEQLYSLPTRQDLFQQLKQLIQSQAGEEPEQQLNALRHFKQEQVLRVAAVDVNEHLSLMKVSDQLTWLAEAILDQVCLLSNQELIAKYGTPRCRVDGIEYRPEMAVIAYGKLGGIELGYGSDLDIVLLHNSAGRVQETIGKHSIDHATYFVRLGQRLVYWLTTQTLAGVLYETDLRLRPDGASGMLVSSLERFEQYQRERAWVWEHQALVRARLVVGSERIRDQFDRIRHDILVQHRDPEPLRREVRHMRERMRKEIAKSRADEFDLKFDRGGLGDIEFLVQYGVLMWASRYPQLTRYSDNMRILEQFKELGLFTVAEVDCLMEAYLQLRAQIHRRALSGEKAIIDDADVERDYVDQVGNIWHRYMEDDA